jgi:hypothetical protein
LGLQTKAVVATDLVDEKTRAAGAIVIFKPESGLLTLYPRSELAKDAAVPAGPPQSGEFSLGQLVASRADVDRIRLEGPEDVSVVATNGTVTDGPYPASKAYIGGFTVGPGSTVVSPSRLRIVRISVRGPYVSVEATPRASISSHQAATAAGTLARCSGSSWTLESRYVKSMYFIAPPSVSWCSPSAAARRDLWVGLALTASWFAIWGLYSAYTWTTDPTSVTVQVVRFYLPALGAISLLGAWLVTRIPGRAGLTSSRHHRDVRPGRMGIPRHVRSVRRPTTRLVIDVAFAQRVPAAA